MHSSFLAFLLLLVTASQGGASPSHRSPRNFLLALEYLLQRTANTCTQAGQTVCSENCHEVILCVSDGHGGFERVKLEPCSSGTRCSAERGTCVTGGSACGPVSGFIQCHAEGYFPDPYDCTIYHWCFSEGIISVQNQCEPGYAYNPLTTDCSFLTTDPVCRYGPVPTCKEVRQAGALPTNPSIYYICAITDDDILVPQLYKCPNGEIFDSGTYTCVDHSHTPITPPPIKPTTTTPWPGPTRPPVRPGGPCWPPTAKVADPADCTRYYECSDHLVWLHAACTIGRYFNPVHGRCEVGWC